MRVHVDKFKQRINPFRDDPWGVGPIRRADVRRAIRERKFAENPYQDNLLIALGNSEDDGFSAHVRQHIEYDYHVRRIAYLVVHGWTDKIEIDVGIPALNYEPKNMLQDGHHRLAAAIYRN